MNCIWLIAICIAGLGEDSGFGVHRAYDEPGDGLVEMHVGKFTLNKTTEKPQTIYLDPKPILDATDVALASGKPGDATSGREPVINITFKPRSGKRLYTATSKLIGDRLAIVFGGKVLMAPVVREAIGKQVRITGDFDKVLVDWLVETLNR